ncbi:MULTISPECIES: acyl-CoA dehydrogenase family protein [unclassified Streptomyces]|uniref:acyl-CoA dehydrogenase family protein n=1 Tax=unclassified Streptomyces TaxID=2593676 RepID=UPI0006B05126|nr:MULTISPECIES: acyl-CoA dehydrogenase family protein [unclassified Streptomyces]KOU84118.1 acyl-CoA dehydrogenase [Streptomyces sp. XY58]KOV04110.1 acyl-CoA dehydrogenase [Streptomyces sp. XY37]KOV45270.1 acyl-CoA dehydrogenase [Streptomyces sp. MMG1064]
MDAAFTAEQDEIRRTLREILGKRCGPDEVKAAARTAAGYDPELWQQLSRQLGLPGIAVAEEYGGVGCGPADLALACEETGRALLPSPLLATAALCAPLIAALGTAAQRSALLPPLASGGLTAALAVPGPALATALALTGEDATGQWSGGGRAGGVQARAGAAGDGWRLYGEAAQVLDGHSASLLLVAAHTGGFARSRTLLFLVREDAPGLVRSRQTVLDETRPQARIQLRDVPAELLGASEGEGEGEEGADVPGALAATGRTASAVLAAEAVGAAGQALARTVEYVRQREQFGRAIGSFQAVKHRLADLYVQVQAARSAAYYAAWDPDQGGLALAQGLEALRLTAGEAIQLHGGIGFTWEHDAHLYFKRAASDELLFGPVHRLRAHAADRAGLFAPAAAPAAAPEPADAAPPAPASSAAAPAASSPAQEKVAV